MCGEAYRTSAEIASAMGPFAHYKQNRDAVPRSDRHAQGRGRSRADGGRAARPAGRPRASPGARRSSSASSHGYKNAQVTVLAPTGTIAFMMDCDTTGVEPDIALVKYKKLVGGGLLKIVNNTVPMALRKLGYDESADRRRSSRTSTTTRRSRARPTCETSTWRSSTAPSVRRTASARSTGWATSA